MSLLLLAFVGSSLAASVTGQQLEHRPPTRPYLNLPASESEPMPLRLSETGAFVQLQPLVPSPSLIPYEINVSFWSDGARKRRWLALPYDGSQPAPQIQFAVDDPWRFPPGTVFVKHFEQQVPGEPDQCYPIETRLLVCGRGGEVFGASYAWRADQSDADLVEATRIERPPAASEMTGVGWYFPGPADCRKCHVPTAGGVLGVNTRQLNRPVVHASGADHHQLRTWNQLGLFDPPLAEEDFASLPSLPPIDDHSYSIETRARAYLDANCAYCHQPGGVVADFDARFRTPLARQNLIDTPARIDFGIDRARLVAPNDVWRSLLLVRLERLDDSKMPPLGHERMDERGGELLTRWIRSLPGPPVLAPPRIQPKGADVSTPVVVTMEHEDSAALIRYTLDGSLPIASSPAYIEPLHLVRSATIRARAFREGYMRSITVQETFIIEP